MTDTATQWVQRITRFDPSVEPFALTPNPLNARRHPQRQRTALRAALDQLGWISTVVVNETTGHVLDGHARIEEAIAVGQTVPVLFVELDADEERVALATFDAITGLAVYDRDVFEELLSGLNLPDALASLVATVDTYTTDELVEILGGEHPPDPVASLGDFTTPDTAPPRTAAGDVWLLGPHRLVCGDCRDPATVARALDGATINIGFTSPPYADRRPYDASSGFVPIRPDDYVQWFEPVAANVAAHLAVDGSWFVNIKAGAEGLDTELYVFDLVIAHARRWGWHYATELCWERIGVPKIVTRRFKNQFEPIFHFARGDWKMRPDAVRHRSEGAIRPPHATAPSLLEGQGRPNFDIFESRRSSDRPKGRDTDWSKRQGHVGAIPADVDVLVGLAYPGNRLPNFGGSHTATGHAAAFPVGLPAFFALAYSDVGDVIFDPFVGSGSTLLAAHETDRRGIGVEISPAYCDITCLRFQQATGITPERDGIAVDFTAGV